ncbi:hypothetical protein DPMN_010134, partial [Dreissena polymorpha]
MMIPDLRPDADGDTVADISTHGLEYVHRLDTHDHNGDKNFSFASYYQNHMVLQGSPKQSIIWGYAPSSAVGQMVTIMIDHVAHNFSVPVMQDQTWAAKLDDMNAGGPHTIQASLSGSVIQLSDVLFGDVWLCSGQSNMQMSMIQVDNSTEEIEDTINYPNIRVFVVSDKISTIPLSDLSSDGGILLPWSLPSPATIGGPPFQYFSAVCWLYGKYLYQHLQKPIGLIDTTWGGTPVEAWSAPEVLEKCGVTLSKPSDNKAASSYDVLSGPTDSSVLWNGMVHPLLNMTIYGAIWYQGESNAAYNRDLYNCTFPGMIDDWRKKFHTASDTDATFPFGFVQLAPFEADYSVSSGFPDIRWHQTADYGYVPNHRLRNVFMAVAMDLPDFLSPYQRCLSRAVGFPVGLFREHVSYEIHTDENGMSLQEVYKMLDYKLLYDALHFTQNMHTAEWNMCVIRRAATILDHHALTYTDLYNIRLGYEAYEAPDMKGMVIDQHKMMRALKMCNLMISPLKLMHRIKHSRDRFDEPGRVQLYEFIDLMLWAEVYQSYVPEKGYALFEMENELFKLVDFDKLLAHHDEKQASRLDARYLKEEWEFPDTKVSKTFKFKDLTVVSGDSRVEVDTCLSDYYLHHKQAMTSHQKKTYKGLRTEVSRSQKMVHCIKGGFIRERPVTAPDLRRYDLQALEEYKRKQSAQAQRAIYNRLHDLIQMVYDKDKGGDVQPVDFSDRPEIPETKRCQTAAVVSPEELDEARRHLECLLFDIETEVGRHEITRDSDMESFIPKYKEKRDMEVERK